MYTVYNDTRLDSFCHRCRSSRDRGHENCRRAAGRRRTGLLWTAKAAVQWHGPPAAASTHCISQRLKRRGPIRKKDTEAKTDPAWTAKAVRQQRSKSDSRSNGPASRLNECRRTACSRIPPLLLTLVLALASRSSTSLHTHVRDGCVDVEENM